MSSDAHSGGQELRITAVLSRILATQRGALLPWAPVFLAIGIGGYFSLRSEPPVMFLASLGALALAGGWIASRMGPVAAPFLWALVLVAAGVALAGARAHLVAGPQIGWRYYGPIEGRIVGIDRSASDAVRIVLDRVVLKDIAPLDTPLRVRLSLHGDQDHLRPWPGQVVITTGHLSVSNGPVEPGSFDFRRHAWFLKLGAVGYARSPVLLLRPPDGGQPVFTARMWLSARVQASLPGEVGAFAAAVMAGDRSGMGQDTLEALRVSNLAHLLAISGLHMGLLTGFVFGLFRLILAGVPVLGLRVPAKKLSAALALLVAAGYLALSGGNVATERAFVMVAVVLVAVIFDRRALTLRAVAVAAMIILTLRPEALMGPGFQMSFAATTALVAVFAWIRDAGLPSLPAWLKPVAAVVVSSGVAGLATAPLGAAHFNQFAHYGLIANLLSVPLMGALVMPAAVLAVCLLPFGLEGVALWIMGQGLGWILWVAHVVSGLEGARGAIVTPPAVVLPLMALGALVLMICQGWGRIIGVPIVLTALLIWTGAQRPAILISGDGGLVGVMTAQGRALSRASGAGFVAQNWLEHDADTAPQADAAARWPQIMPLFFNEKGRLIHLRGKAAANPQCGPDDWLVMDRVAPPGLSCKVFDLRSLRGTGAVAVMRSGDGYRIITVRDRTGARLWNTAQAPNRQGSLDQ